MGHGMSLNKLGERIQRLPHQRAGGVHRDGAVELSCRLVHHIELGIPQKRRAIGWQHTRTHLELSHRPAQLFRRFFRVLSRQERHPVQLAVTRLTQFVG